MLERVLTLRLGNTLIPVITGLSMYLGYPAVPPVNEYLEFVIRQWIW